MQTTASRDINVANDVQAVGGLRRIAKEDKEQALRTVAKQFEAMMLQQLLKSSRETSWDDGFGQGMPGAGAMDNYREWRDEQLAQNLSTKGSLGFADMLVKQLMPKDKSVAAAASANVKETDPLPIKRTMPNNVDWHLPSNGMIPKDKVDGVALPSTEDALLLRNMLQGRHKQQLGVPASA